MLEIQGRLSSIAFSYDAFMCAFTCFDLIRCIAALIAYV